MASFCNNCNSPLDENSPFCPGCGNPVPPPQQQFQQPPQQFAPQQQQPQQFPQQQQPPQQQFPQQDQQFQQQPPQQQFPQQDQQFQQQPPQQQFPQQDQQFQQQPPQQQFPQQDQQFQQQPPQQQFPQQGQQFPQQDQQFQQQGQMPPQQFQQQGPYGGPPQGGPPPGAPGATPPKKGIPKLYLIIGAAALVVIVGVVLAIILLGGSGFEKDEYFEIGGDQVPSVMYVLGETRKITSFTQSSSKSSDRIIVEYSVDSNQGDEMEEYAQALMDDFDFISVNGYDFSGKKGSDIQFAAISEEDDEYVVLVSIDYDSKGYTLTISRGEGSISIGPEEPPATEEPPDDPTPPPDEPKDDPTPTEEPVIEDTPEPETPAPPPAGDIDVTCAGIFLGKTIEAAQEKVPAGVTVVEMTDAGDFVLRFSADIQQKLVVEAIADLESVMDHVLKNHPAVSMIMYAPDDYSVLYIVTNDDFKAEANKQISGEALLLFASYGPLVQVYQGKGLNSVTWIGWGDEEWENIMGELYSPACLYEAAAAAGG